MKCRAVTGLPRRHIPSGQSGWVCLHNSLQALGTPQVVGKVAEGRTWEKVPGKDRALRINWLEPYCDAVDL